MFPLNFFKKPERWASNFFQSFQLKFMASLDNRPFCDRTNTATAEPVLKKSSNRCHLGANRDATGLITTGRSCPWHRPTPCLLVQNKLNQVNVTEGFVGTSHLLTEVTPLWLLACTDKCIKKLSQEHPFYGITEYWMELFSHENTIQSFKWAKWGTLSTDRVWTVHCTHTGFLFGAAQVRVPNIWRDVSLSTLFSLHLQWTIINSTVISRL